MYNAHKNVGVYYTQQNTVRYFQREVRSFLLLSPCPFPILKIFLYLWFSTIWPLQCISLWFVFILRLGSVSWYFSLQLASFSPLYLYSFLCACVSHYCLLGDSIPYTVNASLSRVTEALFILSPLLRVSLDSSFLLLSLSLFILSHCPICS